MPETSVEDLTRELEDAEDAEQLLHIGYSLVNIIKKLRKELEDLKPSLPSSSCAIPVGELSISDDDVAVAGLFSFLEGESWLDEKGWQDIWVQASIDDPKGWLCKKGVAILKQEKAKLLNHPPLLAGQRRRWLVVCRHAGIDIVVASQTWEAA